jgi:hypothetical protein
LCFLGGKRDILFTFCMLHLNATSLLQFLVKCCLKFLIPMARLRAESGPSLGTCSLFKFFCVTLAFLREIAAFTIDLYPCKKSYRLSHWELKRRSLELCHLDYYFTS